MGRDEKNLDRLFHSFYQEYMDDLATLRRFYAARDKKHLETAGRLDELRSFRHVFRNMYRKRLDASKLMALQEGLPETLKRFRENIEGFTALLRRAV